MSVSTEQGSTARWKTGRVIERLEATRRGPQDPLEALRALRHAQDDVRQLIGLWSDAAIGRTRRYAAVADALGVSRQAVRQAFIRRRRDEEGRAEEARWYPRGPYVGPVKVRAARSQPTEKLTRERRRWWQWQRKDDEQGDDLGQTG